MFIVMKKYIIYYLISNIEKRTEKSKGNPAPGGCFSFGGTVQYIEESNIYLCFVVCRLKRGLVT